MAKFTAKIPFAYETKVFAMNTEKPHEAEDKLVEGWEKGGLCDVISWDNEEDKEDNTHESLEKDPDSNLKELEGLEYPELKNLAKEAKIKGYNTMKKEDLIKKLRGE
jgi:hypothetical protein